MVHEWPHAHSVQQWTCSFSSNFSPMPCSTSRSIFQQFSSSADRWWNCRWLHCSDAHWLFLDHLIQWFSHLCMPQSPIAGSSPQSSRSVVWGKSQVVLTTLVQGPHSENWWSNTLFQFMNEETGLEHFELKECVVGTTHHPFTIHPVPRPA